MTSKHRGARAVAVELSQHLPERLNYQFLLLAAALLALAALMAATP